MLEHLEPVILQTLRVCRPYVAALTLEQGLQKCSEVVQAAQKPGMGGVWLPLFCACLVLLSALMFPVYAVYAISSLDTGSPLRLRSHMAVGTPQGVAGLAPRPFTLGEETGSHHGHGHVHRTRMLICMHNWGSSLHLPPLRRLSSINRRHRRSRRRARMHSGRRRAVVAPLSAAARSVAMLFMLFMQ